MTPEEIHQHAKRIVNNHLDDIEFCQVYEDGYLEDAENDWEAIHDEALRLIRGLAV